MGTTSNFFKAGLGAGAGATLGNIAVSSGCHLIASSFSKANQKAYLDYKANIYDGIVRNDIVELYAHDGKWIPTYPKYPFVEKNRAVKKQNLFVRHPILTVFLLITVLGTISTGMNPYGTSNNVIVAASFSAIALYVGIIIALVKKVVKKTVNTAVNYLTNDAKEELRRFGQEYWQVREYVRDALETGYMDEDTAYKTLLETFLVQQLPDKNAQLNALAYNRKKELNLI